MISDYNKSIIQSLAKKYKVSKIILFGSSTKPNIELNDIDLAVNGIKPSLFFKFYSDLMFKLTKPVDLIDLRTKSKFNKLVIEEGLPIYG